MSRFAVAGGATLNYVDERRPPAGGPAVIFHHGMGGDLSQPLGLLPDLRGCRLIAPDARGHGASSDLRPEDASFDVLGDDVIRLADHLGLERFVAAGISLGAGVSLNLALRRPSRVSALILARPAWLDRPMEEWLQALNARVADLIDHDAPDQALGELTADADYQELARRYPATGDSLRGQLTRPSAHNTVVLRTFPRIAPTQDRAAWRTIAVPTLVIAHRDDPVHPFEFGEVYAQAIPGARLVEIPSKERDPAGYRSGFQAAVQGFLETLAQA
ncbi:MAG TPA: alpha/beta fold hydrolase [Solirubrobacteraceae bacterium]|nr:alpha/beta fold hydrolase [Solirubrobacteraceae bacterium]